MIENDRIVSAASSSPTEDAAERALRPRTLTDYVGQKKIREQLEKKRGGRVHVVYPSWVTESIRCGTRLPVADFLLERFRAPAGRS